MAFRPKLFLIHVQQRMSTRWIVVTLPGVYANNRSLFTESIFPIVRKHNGTSARCVCDGFTEAEFKFASEQKAKACKREIARVLKNVKSEPDEIIKPSVAVMPPTYEKNGDRVIVRPDYHAAPGYRAPVCRGFVALFNAR